MTDQELLQKHGGVAACDLPERSGPRFGRRVFDASGEERIYLFVVRQRNTPELAAVHCRTTKATIYAAIGRVRKLLAAAPNPPQRLF